MPLDTENYNWLESAQLYNALKRDEGERNAPYDDSTGKTIKLSTGGKVTIGIGRNLNDFPLTKDEILFLYQTSITKVLADLDNKISWWRKHPLRVQYVLINMCFNLGIGGLLQFEQTLTYIKSRNYTLAASGMTNSRWYKQVGDRAQRLIAVMLGTREEW